MNNLSTKRLDLKPLNRSNLPDIIKLDTNVKVMKYISNGKPRTEEYISNWLKKALRHHEIHGYGLMAVYLKGTHEFIGWAGIKDLDGSDKIELGYRLLDQYWGNGYATEASHALIGFAKYDLKLDVLSAIAESENKGSARVLKKCGFTQKGTARYYNSDVLYFELNLT